MSSSTGEHKNNNTTLKQRSGERIAAAVQEEIPSQVRDVINSNDRDDEDDDEQNKRRNLKNKKRSQSNCTLMGLFVVILIALYNSTNMMGFLGHIFPQRGGEEEHASLQKRQDDKASSMAAILRATNYSNQHDPSNKVADQPKKVVASTESQLQQRLQQQDGAKTNTGARQMENPQKKDTEDDSKASSMAAILRATNSNQNDDDQPKKQKAPLESELQQQAAKTNNGANQKDPQNKVTEDSKASSMAAILRATKSNQNDPPKKVALIKVPGDSSLADQEKDIDAKQSESISGSDSSSDDDGDDENENENDDDTSTESDSNEVSTSSSSTNDEDRPRPGPEEKCTPWEISLDDWWQENPTWEPSFENDTHACFRHIQNPERIQLVEKAHSLQFSGCQNKPMIRHLFPMGFAATLLFHLNSAFWSAYREDRQFIPGIVQKGWKWLYEPTDPTSWASCETHDHECLFLPVTNCPRPIGGKEEKPKKKYQFRELEKNETLQEHNIWLSHYLMRPKQLFRKKIYEYIRDSQLSGILPQVQTPCTWIHVRRADAMTESNYKRNYYFLKEYITRGSISKEDNLLLLTDDQSTIEEANLLYPDYHWHYWDRKRHRGPVHNNAHIPSGDQAFEILTIMAERKLASQCQKGVYGNSNMAKLFLNAMTVEHPGGLQNLTLVQIDRKALRKDRIEPEDFVKELDQQLDAARKKLIKKANH